MVLQATFDLFAPALDTAMSTSPASEDSALHGEYCKTTANAQCAYIPTQGMCQSQMFSLNHVTFWIRELGRATRDACCTDAGMLHGISGRGSNEQIVEHIVHALRPATRVWVDDRMELFSRLAQASLAAGVDRSIFLAKIHVTVWSPDFPNPSGAECSCGWSPRSSIKELIAHIFEQNDM